LNGFVFSGISNRFNKGWHSSEMDMIHRGSYREGLRFIRDFFQYGRDLKLVWGNLNTVERARVHRFLYEIGAAATLGITAILMGSGDDKDKLKENSAGYNYLLALNIAVASEVQTFVPIPGLGMDEIIRKAKNPFAAISQVANISKLLMNFMTMSQYKQATGLDDGMHDKGDMKWIAELTKLLGYDYREYSPIDKVVAVKQGQQIR
jgi:hypothetical protein